MFQYNDCLSSRMADRGITKYSKMFFRLGGFRLIRAFARVGILNSIVRTFLRGLMGGKTIGEIYCSIQPIIITTLRNKYYSLIQNSITMYYNTGLQRERSNYVWFCWLQGIDNAPKIVKSCNESLKRNLKGKEIRIIDNDNWKDYIQLPDFIVRRWKKGQITPAHFTDLIRLELLIQYGGTWIDGTVLCTGSDYTQTLLDTDLFLFQYKRSEEDQYAGISNWFITASTNNYVLMTLRDSLYAYWKEFDCIIDYFIFHRIFDMIAEICPKEIENMPFSYSPNAHVLQRHLWEPFNQEKWDRLTSRVHFHKLTHKIEKASTGIPESNYTYILRQYCTTYE